MLYFFLAFAVVEGIFLSGSFILDQEAWADVQFNVCESRSVKMRACTPTSCPYPLPLRVCCAGHPDVIVKIINEDVEIEEEFMSGTVAIIQSTSVMSILPPSFGCSPCLADRDERDPYASVYRICSTGCTCLCCA